MCIVILDLLVDKGSIVGFFVLGNKVLICVNFLIGVCSMMYFDFLVCCMLCMWVRSLLISVVLLVVKVFGCWISVVLDLKIIFIFLRLLVFKVVLVEIRFVIVLVNFVCGVILIDFVNI